MFTGGLIRFGEAAKRIWSGDATKVLGHATSGPALQQNLVCVMEGGRDGEAASRRHRRRPDPPPGQARGRLDGRPRAARPSTARSPTPSVGFDDIDAVVVGKAPDLFEGVMMPELFLAEALGAAGKPLLRVHTAGSVGGSTAIVAASLVQAGVHKRVLTVSFEKQSESNAMWALSVPMPFNMPVHAGAGGYFAPHVRSYIRRSGAPDPRRRDRGRQGPAERAEEPLRAPARTRTPPSSRCWPRRCCGTRSATTRPARPPTARVRW